MRERDASTRATASSVEKPKSEVPKTQGEVNFTADDVQTYYDAKIVSGLTADDAAKLTGQKFGIKITTNPAGEVQVPDNVPDKEYPGQGVPPEGGGADGEEEDGEDAEPPPEDEEPPEGSKAPGKKPNGAEKKKPAKKATPVDDEPEDEEPAAEAPAAKAAPAKESLDEARKKRTPMVASLKWKKQAAKSGTALLKYVSSDGRFTIVQAQVNPAQAPTGARKVRGTPVGWYVTDAQTVRTQGRWRPKASFTQAKEAVERVRNAEARKAQQDERDRDVAVTSWIIENPEFNTAEFTAYVAQHPTKTVEDCAAVWWVKEFRRLRETDARHGFVPAYPEMYDRLHAQMTHALGESLEATALAVKAYAAQGGLFLSEAKWASKAIKNPGFWKKNAPFGHRDKALTDPSIPMSVHLQTARKHPGGVKGALSAVQSFLNLKQAGPKAAEQLQKLKDRYQQELARTRERRKEAVKRTKERFQ